MRLHALHMNKLLSELRTIVSGTKVGPVSCGQPTFADDIAAAATSKTVLKQKVRRCSKHSSYWRYDYAPLKTVVLVFGHDWEPDIVVTLNGAALQVVKSHPHLGVPLSSCNAAELAMVSERIKSCKRKYYMVESTSGPSVRLTPLTLSRIYHAVCIPALCYGAEVWSPTERSLQEMEKAHQQLGRRIQGLPPTASEPVSHSILGWQTVAGIFDIAKVLWMLRLLSLPYTSPHFQLAVRCFNTCRFGTARHGEVMIGPFEAAYRVCQKYSLTQYVHEMMDTGILLPRAQWKRLCVSAVSELRDRTWHMCRVMYPRLSFFNMAVPGVGCIVWWSVCKAAPSYTRHCKNVVRLITGECVLNSYRGRYIGGAQSGACSLCDAHENETVCHMVTTCPALNATRQTLWEHVESVSPRGMLDSISEMTLQQKTVFLTSGFNGQYVKEWQTSYQTVAYFLSTLYITRCDMVN